ncbi:UDP-N-acetylmuramoyl-tripeptide--D-alanyl-D-alanine ligase [Bacillus toyonensis]|uniref:UDP-N-acetylmuramoyl-tripeptide--D-alanyl-D- alanine ligase n=1 Tax=Bacillus toyonensis TaxID=155322 RepID=UPI002E22CCF5|nr:UDP-N-acetylmuramoyl-tripeptide--D-alanyl-D-alanine ligase [Bacillus toyonensis]
MLEEIIGMKITNVHFNTEALKPGGLFIPIRGSKSDGHSFIEKAIEKGAVATLWNESIEIPKNCKNKIEFILVKDTLKAFQDIANKYRHRVNPIVIGITGSNGKTTTKEFVSAVLAEKFKIHKNEGNYNNHIGVPLTLLSMPEDTEVCIVEMGMNHFGEIELLSNIACPNYAMITNIGESHIGLLGSREGIAKAKSEIIAGLINKENILIDGDEPLLSHIKGYAICDPSISVIARTDSHSSSEAVGIPTEGQGLGKNLANIAMQTYNNTTCAAGASASIQGLESLTKQCNAMQNNIRAMCAAGDSPENEVKELKSMQYIAMHSNNNAMQGDNNAMCAVSDSPKIGEKGHKTMQCFAMQSNNKAMQSINGTLCEIDGTNYVIPAVGNHNFKNAAFAIRLAQLLGMNEEQIQEGLLKYKNQPLRLEFREKGRHTFLLDCYNSSLTSVKTALETFSTLNTNKAKVAIIGDIFELGEESRAIHEKLGEMANANGIEYWFVGNETKYSYSSTSDEVISRYYETVEELVKHLNNEDKELFLLLKASRGMKLEQIYDNL